MAQRFALYRDKEPMQLLFKRVEVLHGLTRCSTLPQKVLQLIHSRGLTGQQGTALQCVHGGSPLVEVVHVTTPVFQRGDAPSSGPHRLQRSRAQTASTFLHQYVIYTQLDSLIGPIVTGGIQVNLGFTPFEEIVLLITGPGCPAHRIL